MSTAKDRVPAIDRFMRKVETTSTCWLWTGGRFTNGYGVFRDEDQKLGRAHRWAYRHFIGDIPEDQVVRHSCDVRHCVNPEHLLTGTASDNQNDCRERGRWGKRSEQARINGLRNKPTGAAHRRARLTAEQALAIRGEYFQGALQRELAQRYGVSRGTISNVVLGRYY